MALISYNLDNISSVASAHVLSERDSPKSPAVDVALAGTTGKTCQNRCEG